MVRQSRGCVRGKELEDRCAERAESERCAGEGIGELFHEYELLRIVFRPWWRVL